MYFTGMAELPAKTRRIGLYWTYQWRQAPIACNERSHCQSGQRSGIHFEQNESRRCLETCRFVPFSASNGNTGCLIVKCLNLSHSEGYLVGKFENQGGGAQRSQSTFSKMKITLKMNEINLSFTVFEVNSYKWCNFLELLLRIFVLLHFYSNNGGKCCFWR